MEKTIGQKLKELRTERGYSQTQLADFLDVSKGTIINWEQDKSTPDIFMTQKILELYDISFEALVAEGNGLSFTEEKTASAAQGHNRLAAETQDAPATIPQKKYPLPTVGIITFLIEIYVYFLAFSILLVIDKWTRNSWFFTLPVFAVSLISFIVCALVYWKGSLTPRGKKDLTLAVCIIDSVVFFIFLFLFFGLAPHFGLNLPGMLIALVVLFLLPPTLAVLIAALLRSIYK